MMTRPFLILFFLSLAAASSAKDYRFYYRQTQLAEESLLNTKFELALAHYDSAFGGYDFKFARDCMIAAQTAAYLNKDARTFRYLTYCVEAGISMKCLKEWSLFDRFWKTPNGKELERIAHVYWNRYMYRTDTALNIEMTRRFDKEQAARGDATIYFDIVDDNINWIEARLDEGRFPGERVLGLMNTVVMAKKESVGSSCNYSTDMAIATLKHYTFAYERLQSRLKAAMYNGDINPREVVGSYIFNRHWREKERHFNQKDLKLEIVFSKTEGGPLFNLPFERKRTDIATANFHRHEWFIPRIGAGLSPEQLLEYYWINVMIGEWKF